MLGVCEGVGVGVEVCVGVRVELGVTRPASDTTTVTPAYSTEPSDEKNSVSVSPVAVRAAGKDVPVKLPS